MKTYHGKRTDRGTTVTVEENGVVRDLDPRVDIRLHSHGYEWGYAGSGPAQLSLALAADVLGDDDKAIDVYQQLKFKLVGGLPSDGWTLTEDRIRVVAAAIEQQRAHKRSY